ncbi:hypothetical protein GTR02_17980 [Kineococcus sp. R8]|nr:hypothetical protein [Kineococcus siccus]
MLVHAILLAYVLAVYVAVLVADGLSATNVRTHWWAHVVAVAVIAATVEPLRRWLRPAVEDLLHDAPGEASDLLAVLGAERGSAAETIARALRTRYVEIVEDGVSTSVAGRRPAEGDVVQVPLRFADDELGSLHVATRRPGVPLTAGDVRLLGDLAHQLGTHRYALAAWARAQESRALVVTAREEERRRIRRDLHDGLGPALASVKLQLAAAQRLLADDPAQAGALLADVRADLAATTGDVRRLVYGLRPPLLDELGLAAAVRHHPAAQAGLAVDVREEDLGELPAAVEVALFRIATEALHNAARHSGGRRCEVLLRGRGGVVELRVSDDGRGLPAPLLAGVGVSAMRERAAELGGSVVLTSGPAGTTVTTLVPRRGPGG